MVSIKNAREIELMSEACKIAASALKLAGNYIKEGISTKEIDNHIHKYIISCGAKPSFLGYGGFPASACISINNQVIHGIPSDKVRLKNGDIVSVDVGAFYNGFHGDNAYTYSVGEISQEAGSLLKATKECLEKGIAQAVPGNRIGDISYAIQEHIEMLGYSIVKDFVGHGIGKNLHEAPEVPNFGVKSRGVRLVEGMALAIEPMINLVGESVKVLPDKWTVETKSGSISAHFEHTIVITQLGAKILTIC